MKKKLIAVILMATLLVAGCGNTSSIENKQDGTMEVVERTWGYAIYTDKETGIMYLKNVGNDGAFTVMLNADGTPKIWQGEE